MPFLLRVLSQALLSFLFSFAHSYWITMKWVFIEVKVSYFKMLIFLKRCVSGCRLLSAIHTFGINSHNLVAFVLDPADIRLSGRPWVWVEIKGLAQSASKGVKKKAVCGFLVPQVVLDRRGHWAQERGEESAPSRPGPMKGMKPKPNCDLSLSRGLVRKGTRKVGNKHLRLWPLDFYRALVKFPSDQLISPRSSSFRRFVKCPSLQPRASSCFPCCLSGFNSSLYGQANVGIRTSHKLMIPPTQGCWPYHSPPLNS